MLLTYSKERFKPAILSGEKIHTIREDLLQRWRVGMKINHWLYNPRHKKLKPAHEFLVNECKGVERIQIWRLGHSDEIIVRVGDKGLNNFEVIELAKNDGLELKEFRMWFVPNPGDLFIGRIIHWTDKKYGNG